MAKALKCDRCGQFYDLLTDFRKYRMQEIDSYEKPIDLCPDCYETFTKWLTGEKPQLDLVCTGELYPGEFESRHYDFEEDSE